MSSCKSSSLCAIVVAIAMCSACITIPTSLSAVTEDDGYVYPDDSSDEEKEEIDEREQEAWEDAGRPGDDDDNDNDDDDSNSNTDDNLPLCRWGVKEDCIPKDGSTPCLVKDSADPCMDIWGGFSGETDAEFSKRVGKIVESSTYPGDDDDGPNPYCDTDKGKAAPVCHDRRDYDQDTGLYPCNDGTNKTD
jgi:hypothetical protein